MLFDAKTQNWTELVKTKPNSGWEEWSRDGDYIYFLGAPPGPAISLSYFLMDLACEVPDRIPAITICYPSMRPYLGVHFSRGSPSLTPCRRRSHPHLATISVMSSACS